MSTFAARVSTPLLLESKSGHRAGGSVLLGCSLFRWNAVFIFFKGIKNGNIRKPFCWALLLSPFPLPFDSDWRLLLHKTILAEISVIFALSLALGNVWNGIDFFSYVHTGKVKQREHRLNKLRWERHSFVITLKHSDSIKLVANIKMSLKLCYA